MSVENKMIWSLHTLPIDMVYLILDKLDEKTILFSFRNISNRLNAITDSYHRYAVTSEKIK